MANATTSTVLEALKYTYGVNKVLYLFNEESPTWGILSKTKKSVGGRGQFIMPILLQNPGAFSGITEGGTIPTALAPDTTEATFSLQEYVAVYDVTWKLIQDARSDKFAFQQAIQMLDQGLRRRVMKNLNSDLIGTGLGELATLTGVDATSVITSGYLPRCEKGMVVDVIDADDNTTKIGNSLTVDGVDPVARTVDLSATLTGEAATDYLVIQDTTTSGAYYHSHGLLGVVNDSDPAAANYGSLDRDTVGQEFWKSPVLSNSGTNRPLTEDLLIQAEDAVREKGGGRLKAWLSNLRVARRYHEMLRNETIASLGSVQPIAGGLGRKGMADKKDDGRTMYEFSGVPWHVDPYFHNNIVIGLDTDRFFIGTGENEVPRPISEIFPGQPTFRQTTSATWQVVWYYQMQLLSDNPAAGVRVEDVAEA